jgi:hypothetical protein
MARENARRYRTELSDRARWLAAHDAFAPVPLQNLRHNYGLTRVCASRWYDPTSTAIAVMCAQALVVGVLLLLEAALSNADRCDSASAAVNCTVEAAQISRSP